jgi:KilA-N domain
MNIPNEYKNLSAIAKASGKRLNNWVNYPVGKRAINDFKLKYPKIDQPLVTKQGKGGGTWAHPELAAIFTAWCNPRFTAEIVEQNVQTEYRNLSVIAKASGKRLNNWVNYPVGRRAIANFKLKYPEIDQPLVTKQGRGGGTYAHPELAAIFVAWCDPMFTAHVVEQNIQLKDQNELLKEKILTFQVDTPAQIEVAHDDAVRVKALAHSVKVKDEQSIELLAKSYFVLNQGANPKGLTFEQYLPHWLFSMRGRTDIYPAAVLTAMIVKAGQPVSYQGQVLKSGCAGVWVSDR